MKHLGLRVGAGISGVWVIALVFSTALIAGEAGIADPATSAALRAFEERIGRLHAAQLARAEARGESSEPPIEKPPPLPPPPRSRLRSVLDRMAISTGWQVEQDSWSAGIRLRYSRSVEFDPASHSFALVEAGEITPAARYEIVALARATKVLVRRTGYLTWEDALLAAPSRWLFVDRPNRVEEAETLAPGTTVTASNETTLFLGANGSTGLGELPLLFRAGIVASG